MAVSEVVDSDDFKTLLRDIYYSEDLKIDSPFANNMKAKLNEICSAGADHNTVFWQCFSLVEASVREKKHVLKGGGREISYKDIFLYQAEQTPKLLAKFPPQLTGSLQETVLWQVSCCTIIYVHDSPFTSSTVVSMKLSLQMIIERLFGDKPDVADAVTSTPARELTAVEENAIYYAAGYVVRKLLKRFEKKDSSKAQIFVGALLDMLGDDPSSNIECTSSYAEYISVWIQCTDHGGLKHVSLDTFTCFKFIEIMTYAALKRGEPKEAVISQIIADENIIFHWELAVNIDQQSSQELLQEVVECWFTIRGFSVASKVFEQYKKAKNTNIRGKKGTRKELHGKVT